MAKRSKNNEEAVSLFPFMSILACLIGILTLMISVSMQVKQMQSDETANKEKALAVENRDLKQKAKKITEAIKKSEEKLKKQSSLSAQLAKLTDHKIVLKKKLDELPKVDDPAKTDAALQKMLELMRNEISTLKSSRPPLSKKLEELKAELAKRKDPPKKVESIVIRSSGSGVRMASRIFFVECNSTGIVIIGEKDGTATVSTSVIATSLEYSSFLKEVQRTRDSMILFLLRKEGNTSYQWAAGIAENNFEIRTGKVPIPNNGKIDLSIFK